MTRFRRLAAAVVSAVIAGLVGQPVYGAPATTDLAASQQRPWVTVTVQTVPALAGVRMRFDQWSMVTDSQGRASVTVAHNFASHTLELIDTTVTAADRRYEFIRWAGQRDPDQAFLPTLTGLPTRMNYTITAAFSVHFPVMTTFLDEEGQSVRPSEVTSVQLRSDAGKAVDLTPGETTWVLGVMPSYARGVIHLSDVSYSVYSVIVRGSNVVDAGRLRFDPSTGRDLVITIPFHRLTVTTRDALFGRPSGSAVRVTGPDGVTHNVGLREDGSAVIARLPRGKYLVDLKGADGIVMSREVSISRDIEVEIVVVGWLDLVVVILFGLALAIGLLLVGRPRWRRAVRVALRRVVSPLRIGGSRPAASGQASRLLTTRLARAWFVVTAFLRHLMPTWWVRVLVAVLALAVVIMLPDAARANPARAEARQPVPVFAYYYAWFNTTSWERAKTDYPLLGRYSSDDPAVVRQHIEWAKDAGIDGFIVSWKDTETNNRRLRLVMTIARELDFKLAMIYQGLDFERKPQPVQRVAADFRTFREEFAPDPVFYRIRGKPLTIWSGTWAFSYEEIAAVTDQVRDGMLVLATEKGVDGYQRIADLVDGDAYYWSSVNPETNTYYDEKLRDMSEAIHADGKLWIAPLAPGFDARLVGGTREVPRKDGETLRREYAAAVNSSPDLLGLISWNEFSENTHVEPSERYGTRYLDVLRELRGTTVPEPTFAADSSQNDALAMVSQYWPNILILAAFPLFLVGMTTVAARRRRRYGATTNSTSQSSDVPLSGGSIS
ncbi:MAG: hypothetical protein IRY85_09805 [Micromonosporaceae bacterium]|nr:hypothetical protein [Micromonosporaceae bacterium]